MSTSIYQQKQDLQAQIGEANEKLAVLEGKLRSLENLLLSISGQRQKYQVLSEISTSLEKLGELGADELFWAGRLEGLRPEQEIQRIHVAVTEFQQKVAAVEQSRSALQDDIQVQLDTISQLKSRLAGLREIKGQVRSENEPALAVHFRPAILPWSKQGEDERRFHKILLIFFLCASALGTLVSFWKLPPPDIDREVVVPERLAQLIKKKQEKPPEPKPQEKKEEKPTDKEEKPADKGEAKTPARKAETQQARAKAETKGVLAFKDNIADLMKDASDVKLGADTRVSNSGKQSAGEPSRRSIIVAQGGSGGIGSSSPGRQGVGIGRQSMASSSMKIARVESAISGDAKEPDRPQKKGLGPSRSDEEIQIVFDRYKAALYRIYNRELRNDPSLRGKMVLRITIETDGHVSACSVKSTDLASPTLSTEIVDRVLKFNFGPKEGVPATTILYPIEFLPAI